MKKLLNPVLQKLVLKHVYSNTGVLLCPSILKKQWKYLHADCLLPRLRHWNANWSYVVWATTTLKLHPEAVVAVVMRRSNLGARASPRSLHAPPAARVDLVWNQMTQKAVTHQAVTSWHRLPTRATILTLPLRPPAAQAPADVCVKSQQLRPPAVWREKMIKCVKTVVRLQVMCVQNPVDVIVQLVLRVSGVNV